MNYRRLGNSGTAVATLALGTMTFGNEADETTSRLLMSDYVAAGGNFIDTADVYTAGESEEIIGRWLADHPVEADRIVLATKARFHKDGALNEVGVARPRLRKTLDASLKRMGVDHIHLYQMHGWDPLTPIEETARFLNEAITAGKISYYGFSNFTGWQLTKAVYVARELGLHPPVTLQPQYSLMTRELEWEVVPAALDANIGLLPWSPLGGGWLTGKYKRDQMPVGDTRLGQRPDRGFEAYDARNAREQTWRILKAVESIAEAHNASMAQVALAWVAQRPAVTSVLLGARNQRQLADNLGAATVRLSDDDMTRLNNVSHIAYPTYPYSEIALGQRSRTI